MKGDLVGLGRMDELECREERKGKEKIKFSGWVASCRDKGGQMREKKATRLRPEHPPLYYHIAVYGSNMAPFLLRHAIPHDLPLLRVQIDIQRCIYGVQEGWTQAFFFISIVYIL